MQQSARSRYTGARYRAPRTNRVSDGRVRMLATASIIAVVASVSYGLGQVGGASDVPRQEASRSAEIPDEALLARVRSLESQIGELRRELSGCVADG